MSQESIREGQMLGAIGALFKLFLFTSLIGWALWLVAMGKLSQDLDDRSIFRNALVSFLVPLIGGLVLWILFWVILIVLAAVFGNIPSMGDSLEMGAFVLFIILAGMLAWALIVVSSIYQAKVCKSLASHFGDSSFSMAATLFNLGGWLSILLVGGLLIWVGWLIVMIAFFKKSKAEVEA